MSSTEETDAYIQLVQSMLVLVDLLLLVSNRQTHLSFSFTQNYIQLAPLSTAFIAVTCPKV